MNENQQQNRPQMNAWPQLRFLLFIIVISLIALLLKLLEVF